MPKAKDSTLIGVTVPKTDKALLAEMEKRAQALGSRWSVSGYGLEIWRWWHAQGCPAVSAQDQAMIIAGQMAATKKAGK